jgi:predicted dithiol-disulfide oxidoreductase (DUF899 family)
MVTKSGPFMPPEMPAEAADPGQDPRTAPDIASLWNLLDLTPEGRVTKLGVAVCSAKVI